VWSGVSRDPLKGTAWAKGVTPDRAAARVSGDEAVGERVDAVARRSDA
jgi:hypothetical protein